MCFMTYQTNMKKLAFKPMVMSQFPLRNFASLPDHIMLEMPNLSPTMEKVSLTF